MAIEKEIIITGLICIGILEGIALLKGVDGALLALVFAIISGLCGYKIGGVLNGRRVL